MENASRPPTATSSPVEKPAETAAKPVSLMQRIHRAWEALPDGERRVAEHVLDSPGELALWPANELAARAGVSGATVSRFFRRLGYSGYDAARRDSRAMRAAGSPLFLADADTDMRNPGGRPGGRITEHLASEQAAIEMTLAMVNPHALDELADRLATARRGRVQGYRNSHFVAEYFRTALSNFRPDVQMIGWSGQTAAESMGDIGPGDVAVVFGLRRRPRIFAALIAALGETGADVALISDPTLRGAPAATVRWTLTCAVETPQIFDTLAGAMALSRLVAAETMHRLGPEGRRHLERIERTHDRLDDLE